MIVFRMIYLLFEDFFIIWKCIHNYAHLVPYINTPSNISLRNCIMIDMVRYKWSIYEWKNCVWNYLMYDMDMIIEVYMNEKNMSETAYLTNDKGRDKWSIYEWKNCVSLKKTQFARLKTRAELSQWFFLIRIEKKIVIARVDIDQILPSPRKNIHN